VFSDEVDARKEPGARAETAWRELQWRIQGEEKKSRKGGGSWQRFALPIAAGILFVAVGLGVLRYQRHPSLVTLQTNQEVTDGMENLPPTLHEIPAPGVHRGVEASSEKEAQLTSDRDYFLGLPLPSEVSGY